VEALRSEFGVAMGDAIDCLDGEVVSVVVEIDNLNSLNNL